MSDNMFRDVVEPTINVGGKRRYAVPLSIAAHTFAIAAVVIVPLVATNSDVLPIPPAMLAFVDISAPSAPPPPPAPRPGGLRRPPATTNTDAAPVEAPHEITADSPIPSSREPIVGVEKGTGILEGGEGSAPPSPPPPLVVAAAPVRPGGNIKQPIKVRSVAPTYPAIAQTARVQGVVIIEATIGPTGIVQDARVLRSIPLLDAAALDAVRQWEYTPTLLNGIPTAVVMTVTVDFRLR